MSEESKIWRVADGSVWYFDAPSRTAAREQWLAALRDIDGYQDDGGVLNDYGEPVIRRVTMRAAMKILVTDDEDTVQCEFCGGSGRLRRKVPLLDWWRTNREKLPEDRARWGALSNSEWD